MDAKTLERIKEKVKRLPTLSGVYLMQDENGKIIYVGKAKSLKNRVSQYFNNLSSHSGKTRRMVERVADFEYFVTPSEMEALILECSQIKLYMPKYNILLKDNKTYPYIKIDLKKDFSTVQLTRRRSDDGARYFGPYSGGVKYIIDTVNRTFALPDCKRVFPRDFGRERPCLKRDIGLCLAPCTGEVSAERYREAQNAAVNFLTGEFDGTVRKLKAEMEAYSDGLDFEKAAQVRDRLRSLMKLEVRQKVVAAPDVNRDIIGVACNDFRVVVEVFFLRGGRIIDRQSYNFSAETAEDMPKLLSDFIGLLYSGRADIPPEVICCEPPEDIELWSEYLQKLRGRSVSISVPQRGDKKKQCDMVCANAAETLRLLLTKEEKKNKILADLQKLLGLSEPPYRIEAVDISNTAGTDTVGAIVCYENGEPDKNSYRRYKIETVSGQDDYAAMREVMSRRFVRILNGDEGFAAPDLLLLDGGAQHLGVVTELLDGMGLKIPVFGMVKDEKHRTRAIISRDGEIALTPSAPAAAFIGRVQEEVHRFVIDYHKKKRATHIKGSMLESIEGVGPKRAKALLVAFGSVRAIAEATPKEIAARVKGLSEKTARVIISSLAK